MTRDCEKLNNSLAQTELASLIEVNRLENVEDRQAKNRKRRFLHGGIKALNVIKRAEGVPGGTVLALYSADSTFHPTAQHPVIEMGFGTWDF